uniref:Uncharacterized protein n=1 Tax=Parascaris equorum TaxID=6256 RepID=A0A914RR48_PAREQ
MFWRSKRDPDLCSVFVRHSMRTIQWLERNCCLGCPLVAGNCVPFPPFVQIASDELAVDLTSDTNSAFA